jgi:RNA polymerase sigma-70 factor (ECF subfamily)
LAGDRAGDGVNEPGPSDVEQGMGGGPVGAPALAGAGGAVGEATFESRYPELFERGYRAAYRLLGDREEAFDVAQESCARAYIRWDDLVHAVNVTAWVVRTSTNLAIDRWRRLRTASRHRAERPDGAADPAAAERVDLHRALDALPGRQREVVVLRYVADLSQDDVAAVLGCNVGTVKTHASRGLAALRAALAPGEER